MKTKRFGLRLRRIAKMTSKESPIVQAVLDNNVEAIEAFKKNIADLEATMGTGAGEQLRETVRRQVGRALLRKVQRENPSWDGKNRVLP